MAHLNYDIDFTVGAFICHEDKVLLVHHKQLERWLPVGGHIDPGEDSDEALLREIREESGLEVEVLSERPTVRSPGTKFLWTPAFVDIHRISDTHRHTCLIYFCSAATDQVRLAPEEHHAIRWFSDEDLDLPAYNLSPGVKFYCRQALQKVRVATRSGT